MKNTNKFRVWHKKKAAWISDEVALSMDADGNWLWDWIYEDMPPLDNDDIIIQQSTGLFDKNGIEIFEGDIFESKHYEWGPVKYNDGAYQVNLMGARVFDLSEFFEYGEHVMPQPPLVIGNILENP